MARDPQIKFIVGDLRRFSGRQVKSLALRVTSELIEATPVDTGWARANWIPAVGAPSVFTGQGDPDNLGSRKAQQATATAGLLLYDVEKGPIFVSNGVPYIGALNAGNSKQAPSGFVRMAIARAVRSA